MNLRYAKKLHNRDQVFVRSAQQRGIVLCEPAHVARRRAPGATRWTPGAVLLDVLLDDGTFLRGISHTEVA
jgi:hypothetical protein